MQNHNTTSSATVIGTTLSTILVGALVAGVAPASQAAGTATLPVDGVAGAAEAPAISKLAAKSLSNSKVVPMKNFEITAKFGSNSGVHSWSGHSGVDLAAPHGQKVISATDGKVIQTGSAGAYGNLVTVRTSSGKKVLYAHLSKIAVKKGDKIKARDRLGSEGSTGRSTGPHLHFEVWNKKGNPIGPVKFLGITYKQLAKAGE